MPRLPRSLRLLGFLRIGSRKWQRALAVHRGGAFEAGIMELHLTGKAPGGFPMQIMQVSLFDACQWALAFLRWARGVKQWAITKEQLVEAEAILAELESLDQSTS